MVFLGTPEVAAVVLGDILAAAAQPDSDFEVAAVVSQPGRPKGRGKRNLPQPSPVEALAIEHGIAKERIWCPEKAGEAGFLSELQDLEPHLCVTAAYGNILPRAFLEIPRRGTLNIHPSLLPMYRGAAPVQRALQDGCTESGVSVAFTVRAMDAGPILAQEKVQIDPDIQSPQLLEELFSRGTRLLLRSLPQVWTGEAAELAVPQDESAVTHAAKLTKEEGVLDFREHALIIHNKVRAFAGWPGTTAAFKIGGDNVDTLKILETRVRDCEHAPGGGGAHVAIKRQSMLVHCKEGGCLEILRLQPAGRKPMAVAAFLNGLKGRAVHLP